MTLFFPWTLHFQGPAFITYASTLARAASVLISILLDHCLKPSDADLALECAFDSIMVSGSMYDPDESIDYVRSMVDKARVKGITITAELGRIEGGEDRLPTIDLEGVYTDPDMAGNFVDRTGVHFLAPIIGNVHGPYQPNSGGMEKYQQLDRLRKTDEILGDEVPLALHCTTIGGDKLVRETVRSGMRKVNHNRKVRERYMKYMEENSGNLESTELQTRGVQIYPEGMKGR